MHINTYNFNNLENDLFHWIKKYPEYFPLGARYLKKTQTYFETFGNLYISRMISKYKKCFKKGIIDEEAYYTAALANIFGINTKTDHNEGFHILLNLFEETSNLESGFIVLMIILMIVSSDETNDIFKRMRHEYAMYFKEHPFAPADFALGAYCHFFVDEKTSVEFLTRSMDDDFAPAYAFYIIFSEDKSLYERAIQGIEDSLFLEEKMSTYAKGTLLFDEAKKTQDLSKARLGLEYLEKAAFLKDVLAIGFMAEAYCSKDIIGILGKKADYEIAYNYACRGADLNSYAAVFTQARLHLENKIPNANRLHGEILMGKALYIKLEIAIKYCDEHNLDKEKLINTYIEYMS